MKRADLSHATVAFIFQSIQEYSRFLFHKTSLRILSSSYIFHGGKSTGRLVPARLLLSGACHLNHGTAEKRDQQLQVLKYVLEEQNATCRKGNALQSQKALHQAGTLAQYFRHLPWPQPRSSPLGGF